MKPLPYLLLLATLLPLTAEEAAVDAERAANIVILDEVSVKNLGIELADALETDFEETVFAIGRIAEIPTNHSVLSSRIPGRIVELNAIAGDQVTAGQVLVRVESRQPGDPPPVIPLPAPITGTILESHVRVGEPVEPERELLDIVDLTAVWAIASVPEQEAGRLQIGSRARIRVAALPNETFEGELIRFGTQADVASGTLHAIFRLANPELHLRPGMRAEFSIITDSRANVMAVPREAIQGDAANRVVYVEDFDLPNAYLRTPVQTGARNDRFVEIVSGLFPGDRVVTTGSYFLGSATGGSVSLKEALDAAHGHEHAEDGSELTEAQGPAHSDRDDHGHAANAPVNHFLTITSVLLFVLLVLSGIKHWRDARTSPAPSAPGSDA